MKLLYALESIRTPLLDTILGAVTHMGGEFFFMVIAVTVFWCVSKRMGYYLMTVGFFGTILNQFLKILCCVPRPWVKEMGDVKYGKMPDGFSIGTEYTAEEINAALQMHTWDRYRLIPSRDLSGHGTAVAGIAAGRSADGLYTGAAPEAELIVVKLGLPGNTGGVE